jgi:ABC-type methionine transport system ATPase subunit
MDAGVIVEQGPVAQVFLHPRHATTQRFVRESEHVDEGEQHDDFAHVSGRILRLTFQGEATYAPLLGTVARETGVDYSILAGRIDRIKDNPYGQLTLAFTGGDIDAALAEHQAAEPEQDELSRARAAWARKFTALPANREDYARQYRFLASRGFASGIVSKVLSGRDRD